MNYVLIFLITFTFSWARALGPLDVVWDIDQTIATKVHDEPHGDLLADPKNPTANTLTITFDEPLMDKNNKLILDELGKPILKNVTETYRIYQGVQETMTKLKALQKTGNVRVSFFSGGSLERNEALLKAIKLQDGSNLAGLAQKRIYGRTDMTVTGLDETHRIRERFKKDITLINKDVKNVVLVDDIHNFVPDSQLDNVLNVDYNFPYPERRMKGQPFTPPDQSEILREQERFKKNSEIVFKVIDESLKTKHPLVHTMKYLSHGCSNQQMQERLNSLLLSH